MRTTLTFTTDGQFFCDGLAQIHPGLRAVRIGGGLKEGEHGCPECPRFLKCGMSHVSTITTEVSDLAAVQMMCQENGWTFHENQKTYRWYGRFVGDAPLPPGMKVEDLGKCTHAISVPGCGYDIGLVYNPKTKGYTLAYDYWGTGQKLKEAIGENGGKFLQHYGVCKATLIARSKGYFVQRSTLKNGAIKLQVSGM